MTFHTIVRQWCKIYKPMLDNEKNGNRRFFLTDSQNGTVELAKKIANEFSPCVLMESAVEGEGKITRPQRNYPITFLVRARDMSDGDAAAEAKEEAWWHCQNFLTWLLVNHNREEDEGKRDGDFARINLDDAYILITSVGPLENGWYGVLLQIDRDEPLNLCIDEDLYLEPTDSADLSD